MSAPIVATHALRARELRCAFHHLTDSGNASQRLSRPPFL
jgi:hypothetical protein